jgi:hypothetical protein
MGEKLSVLIAPYVAEHPDPVITGSRLLELSPIASGKRRIADDNEREIRLNPPVRIDEDVGTLVRDERPYEQHVLAGR